MTEDNWVPISALQHYSYCPRQCALIHQEQVFADNIHTARGHAVHKQVDEPGFETRPGFRIERSLPLYSQQLGLTGKADIVEFQEDGTPYPVEYKHGPRRQRLHDDLQLTAQALCLEEMTGKTISEGAIYHASSRRRRIIPITQILRTLVAETTTAIRDMLASGQLPPPVNDSRCKECSLIELCQPDMLNHRNTLHALRQSLFTVED